MRRAHGVAVEAEIKPFFNRNAFLFRLAGCGDVFERMPDPAAVRGEGENRFLREIIAFEKRLHGGGEGVPPDGRAEHDYVVIGGIHGQRPK